MDNFAATLGNVGAAFGRNKYLNAIKNAFQNFMPATISGAVGVLWTNVLVNASTGLGAIFSPIMALQVLNPIFTALSYATISCITIGVTMLLAAEIGEANGETGSYPAVMGFILWMMVTPTSFAAKDLSASYIDAGGVSHGFALGDFIAVTGDAAANGITADSFSYSGIMSSYTSATGIFTGMIAAIAGMEIYNIFRKNDNLKIKMPEQVPPGVAKAFEVLVPTCLAAIVIGAVGLICELATGAELNAFIYNTVQAPLGALIGNNIVAICIMYVIIMLFWCIGIHGNNMVSAIKEPIFRPLLYANTVAFQNNQDIPNLINLTTLQMFCEWGGSGCTLALVVDFLIFSKREDNRTIAGISVVPGLFNINETVVFGVPLVLNPILDIPFILVPCACAIIIYVLTSIGFCPRVVLEVPWTMPPFIGVFLATGGKPMAVVTWAIEFVAAMAIYFPFMIAYEANQAKEAEAE